MRQKRGVAKHKLIASLVVGMSCLFLFAGLAVAQGGALVAAEYGAGDRPAWM